MPALVGGADAYLVIDDAAAFYEKVAGLTEITTGGVVLSGKEVNSAGPDRGEHLYLGHPRHLRSLNSERNQRPTARAARGGEHDVRARHDDRHHNAQTDNRCR